MHPNNGFAPIVQEFVKWVLSECFTIHRYIHTFLQNFSRNLIKYKDSGHCVFQFWNCKIQKTQFATLSEHFCNFVHSLYFPFPAACTNKHHLHCIWHIPRVAMYMYWPLTGMARHGVSLKTLINYGYWVFTLSQDINSDGCC